MVSFVSQQGGPHGWFPGNEEISGIMWPKLLQNFTSQITENDRLDQYAGEAHVQS